MNHTVQPFALKDAPALIERLLPVQKLYAEAYKEQEARQSKTLTALGSYWKGRKPLILNKACILGCLLPATDNPKRDLEIFEKLMAMDDESFVARWPRRAKPREILAKLSIARVADYFVSDPPMLLPPPAPVDWSKPELQGVKVTWRDDISELERRQIEVQMLPKAPYRERVDQAKRPEEVMDSRMHCGEVSASHSPANPICKFFYPSLHDANAFHDMPEKKKGRASARPRLFCCRRTTDCATGRSAFRT